MFRSGRLFVGVGLVTLLSFVATPGAAQFFLSEDDLASVFADTPPEPPAAPPPPERFTRGREPWWVRKNKKYPDPNQSKSVIMEPEYCGKPVYPNPELYELGMRFKVKEDGVFPSYVQMKRNDGRFVDFCAGTIIGKQTILTSPRCVRPNKNQPPPKLQVYPTVKNPLDWDMKRYNITPFKITKTCMPEIRNAKFNSRARARQRWRSEEEWDRNVMPTLAIGIADRPFEFNEKVQPACLPTERWDDKKHEHIMTVGPGFSQPDIPIPADQPQAMPLKVNRKNCHGVTGFCVEGVDGGSLCTYDRGAPMYTFENDITTVQGVFNGYTVPDYKSCNREAPMKEPAMFTPIGSQVGVIKALAEKCMKATPEDMDVGGEWNESWFFENRDERFLRLIKEEKEARRKKEEAAKNKRTPTSEPMSGSYVHRPGPLEVLSQVLEKPKVVTKPPSKPILPAPPKPLNQPILPVPPRPPKQQLLPGPPKPPNQPRPHNSPNQPKVVG